MYRHLRLLHLRMLFLICLVLPVSVPAQTSAGGSTAPVQSPAVASEPIPPAAQARPEAARQAEYEKLLRDRNYLIIALVVVFVLSKAIMAGLVIYLRRKNKYIARQKEQVMFLNNDLRENNRFLNELLEERKSLVHLVAHDLRSPLSLIRMMLRNAEHEAGQTGAPASAQFKEMQRAAASIEALTQKIIDIQEGRVPALAEPVDVSLGTVLDTTMAEYQPLARQRRISLDMPDPNNKWVVRGNQFLLASVVGNLLSNAIRMSPPGETVKVSIQRQQGSIVVQVTDKGPGIDPAVLPGLFDTRPDAQWQQQADPAGLVHGYGLYLTKVYVQKMQGDISAENGQGGGAVFTLKFPASSRHMYQDALQQPA